MSNVHSLIVSISLAASLVGCGGKDATSNPDTPLAEAGSEAASDSGSDATVDATVDATAAPTSDAESAAACGPIRASDYDRSCSTNTDCAWVYEGDTCEIGSVCDDAGQCAGGCACPNATISRAAIASYHPVLPANAIRCPCLALGEPTCSHGTCKICVQSTGACVGDDGGAGN